MMDVEVGFRLTFSQCPAGAAKAFLVQSLDDAMVAVSNYYPDFAAAFTWRDVDGMTLGGKGAKLLIWENKSSRDQDSGDFDIVATIENLTTTEMSPPFVRGVNTGLLTRRLREVLRLSHLLAHSHWQSEVSPPFIVAAMLTFRSCGAAKLLRMFGAMPELLRGALPKASPRTRGVVSGVIPANTASVKCIEGAISRSHERVLVSSLKLLVNVLEDKDAVDCALRVGVSATEIIRWLARHAGKCGDGGSAIEQSEGGAC